MVISLIRSVRRRNDCLKEAMYGLLYYPNHTELKLACQNEGEREVRGRCSQKVTRIYFEVYGCGELKILAVSKYCIMFSFMAPHVIVGIGPCITHCRWVP
jgi:hypothetical protein